MNMTENTEQFECFSAFFSLALQPLAITLDESKQKLFFQFYMDLIEKNKHMNLTAIVEMKEVIVKHFVDSLSVVQAIPDIQFEAYRILDLGTGAGFPGIPLAIAWPQLKLTLVDCLNKRIHFIEEECRKLGLHNIIALHARAEDLAGKQEHREQYDLILSRAVSNLSTMGAPLSPINREKWRKKFRKPEMPWVCWEQGKSAHCIFAFPSPETNDACYPSKRFVRHPDDFQEKQEHLLQIRFSKSQS